MTRSLEMRSTIETAEHGRVTMDQDGEQIVLRWTETVGIATKNMVVCRSFALDLADFDQIADEVERFRLLQAQANDAPEDEADVLRVVS